MKRLDWVIVLLLLVVGLSCLTMSAMMYTDSTRSYFTNFLQICLWIGLPAVGGGLIYYVIKGTRKRRDS
ncbi:hypothetical protein [Jeotgalibacillus marinus]|uniref:Cardiolipin synthase N-terminal domain-containing protein n=1 Tax=Jeotgalibacillus marinus TaxID=86667 RepID=A0ABV3Q629_9BACL